MTDLSADRRLDVWINNAGMWAIDPFWESFVKEENRQQQENGS